MAGNRSGPGGLTAETCNRDLATKADPVASYNATMTGDAVKAGCALALLWTTIPATGQHQLLEDGELGAVMADIRQRIHDRIPAIDGRRS